MGGCVSVYCLDHKVIGRGLQPETAQQIVDNDNKYAVSGAAAADDAAPLKQQQQQQQQQQPNRKQGKLPAEQVLFFPIDKMPCRYMDDCRRAKRGQCNYSHEQTSLTQLLDHLRSARRSLDICVFTITCNEISNEIKAAQQRGVTVRVITDDDTATCQGSDIPELARTRGIAVRHDDSPMHMHHKYCVIDGKKLINGSFNWTRQAVLGNQENIVITSQRAVVRQFQRHFDAYFPKCKRF